MNNSNVEIIPAPTWLSDGARATIEQPIIVPIYPPLDDTEGWQRLRDAGDEQLLAILEQLPLPSVAEQRTVDGVPVAVIKSDSSEESGPVYLDIHGGALINGGGAASRILGQITAMMTGVEVWAVDYRMPPEHPYPAGLDDVVTTYRALLRERAPQEIIVGGSSAGGNLASALCLRIASEGLPMPAGLVLHTPEVDLTESGDSFATLKHVSVGLQSLRDVNLLYANGHDLADPLLSPLFGNVAEFPPTLLMAGTRDLFLSNTVRMHRALRDAGVYADLHVIDARPHSGFGGAPEDAVMAAETRRFIQRVLHGRPKHNFGVAGTADE